MEAVSNLIWLCARVPWPAEDGSSVATVSLLKELSELGHQIELICLPHERPRLAEEEVRSALRLKSVRYLVRREINPSNGILRHLLSNLALPITLRDFCTKSMRRAFASIPKCAQSLIILDGVHHAAMLDREELKRAIYRAQNIEAQIWYTAAQTTSNPFKRILLAIQGGLMERFERRVCQQVLAVATVSEADRQASMALYRPKKIISVPVGYEFSQPLEISRGEQFRLLFVGKLDWKPNSDGLNWFLNQIWPKAFKARPQLRLEIVGSGKSGLESLPQGVTLHGRVPEVEPYYKQASLVIVPIRFGGGTRVKAIEAARFGRAILSTTLGVEGLPLNPASDYLQAESADEWVRILTALSEIECADIGARGFSALRSEFDSKRCAINFQQLLSDAYNTVSDR